MNHPNLKVLGNQKFIGLLLLLSSSIGLCQSQILILNENKRLEAHIALDMMNRLAVANDRIVNIFGDEGTFVNQTDEQTGQVFIKPTDENGHNPLSITIITENGLTQDLLLTPSEPMAATLIIKAPPTVSKLGNPQENLIPGFTGNRSVTVQDQIIQTIKQAVLKELPERGDKPTLSSRTGFKSLSIHFKKHYQSGPYVVSVWEIKNLSNQVFNLHEKQFFKTQDLALSLQKLSLAPGEKTELYTVEKA